MRHSDEHSAWWLSAFLPFRRGVVALPRHSLARNLSVVMLKTASRNLRIRGHVSSIRPLDRPEIAFEPVDSMVMDAVYWFGVAGYEGLLGAVWESLCRGARNVLEVGGNIGIYTVLGGRMTEGRYTVLEPLPNLADILRANLRRNGLDRVELSCAAAIPDREARKVAINVPNEGRDAPVGAHLVGTSTVTGRDTSNVLTVEGLPFAGLAEGRDLIKIDAEGVEAALLGAARTIIERDKPTLVLEVLPEAEELAALVRSLAETCGYRIQVVPAYGSEEIVTVPAERFRAATPQAYKSKDIVLSIREIGV